MKDIKKSFSLVVKDRMILFLMILCFIFGIIFFISTISGAQFYDRLIHVRYTAFGRSNLYKDVWYTRVFISMIGVFSATIYNVIIAKIYSVFGRKMAILFAIINIVILIFSMIIASNILNEIPN